MYMNITASENQKTFDQLISFITENIQPNGLETLHLPQIPSTVEFRADMLERLTRNLNRLTHDDRYGGSDQDYKQKSKLLFQMLSVCNQSTQLCV